jgi:hypothetical protein
LSIIRTLTPGKTKQITIAATATLAVAVAGGIATAVEGHGTTARVRQASAGAAVAVARPAHALVSMTSLDVVAAVKASTATARPTTARRHPPPQLTARQIARKMLPGFGWSASQFGYLSLLWNRESGWRVSASNPTTGAYGIPQAVPGDKMASAGRNWATSAGTQIRWGLRYIKAQYGSPYWAWQHEQAAGWY